MYILKDECRILKYIKENPDITKSELLRKFPHFDNIRKDIIHCLDETNKNHDIFKEKEDDYNEKLYVYQIPEYVSGEIDPPEFIENNDNITYRINRAGREYFEKKHHDFWFFILPYGITTFIALISAAPTIYKIFKFICNLFVQGTP